MSQEIPDCDELLRKFAGIFRAPNYESLLNKTKTAGLGQLGQLGRSGESLVGMGRAGVAGASDVGFAQHLTHVPSTINEIRHTADGLASSFSLGNEAAHNANKLAPAARAVGAAAGKIAPVANATSKLAPAANAVKNVVAPVASATSKLAPSAKFITHKAAPALWALDMGVQAANVYSDPEANKQQAMDMANQGAGSRAWSAVNNPVKTIAGTAQVAGDLAKTTADNYLENNRFKQQQQKTQQQQFFNYKPPLETDKRLARPTTPAAPIPPKAPTPTASAAPKAMGKVGEQADSFLKFVKILEKKAHKNIPWKVQKAWMLDKRLHKLMSSAGGKAPRAKKKAPAPKPLKQTNFDDALDALPQEEGLKMFQEGKDRIKKAEILKLAKSKILKDLLEAKELSDNRDFVHKNEILRKLVTKYPKQFKVDSHLNNAYVGLTHKPTGFKIHAQKKILPSEIFDNP